MDKKQKYLVSVIIPVKNRANLLLEAINSVKKQKLPNNFSLELIVVDDGSKVPVENIVNNYDHGIKLLTNTNMHGPSGARNFGLNYSKGDFICFLDCDDSWKDNFLYESLSTHIVNEIPATVCLTNPYFVGEFNFTKKIKILMLNYLRTFTLMFNYYFNNGVLPKSGFYLCQLSHMVFNRKYISGIKFNTTAVAAEDWEFSIQATQNKEIEIIPSALVNFRYEKKSFTNDPKIIVGKKEAYYKLINKIPYSHKNGLLYKIFLIYIELFLIK